jgi:hypothetical protein
VPSQEELDGFVRDPRESLDTELKGWIDPATNEGIIKIARAVIALFNNNGGRLIVGITNDGNVDTKNVPADVRKSFHPDVIQAIATKFASQAFEVSPHEAMDRLLSDFWLHRKGRQRVGIRMDGAG